MRETRRKCRARLDASVERLLLLSPRPSLSLSLLPPRPSPPLSPPLSHCAPGAPSTRRALRESAPSPPPAGRWECRECVASRAFGAPCRPVRHRARARPPQRSPAVQGERVRRAAGGAPGAHSGRARQSGFSGGMSTRPKADGQLAPTFFFSPSLFSLLSSLLFCLLSGARALPCSPAFSPSPSLSLSRCRCVQRGESEACPLHPLVFFCFYFVDRAGRLVLSSAAALLYLLSSGVPPLRLSAQDADAVLPPTTAESRSHAGHRERRRKKPPLVFSCRLGLLSLLSLHPGIPLAVASQEPVVACFFNDNAIIPVAVVPKAPGPRRLLPPPPLSRLTSPPTPSHPKHTPRRTLARWSLASTRTRAWACTARR